MVLEAPGGCCEAMHCFTTISTRLLWSHSHFYKEILMVLEASGGCCESMHCFTSISRRLLWSHSHTFTKKYWRFWKLQEAAVNPCIASQQSPRGCCETIHTLLQINIYGFGSFRKLLWIHALLHSNLQEVAVKPFAHFYKEIFMVLEASGGCCEAMHCFTAISKRLLWSHSHCYK